MKFLPTVLALLSLQTSLAAAGQRIVFDVLLDARPIGTHSFEIDGPAAGEQRVTSLASFNVKFLSFTAYRYRHQASERWQQGCLAEINSTTDDNGKRLRVDHAPRTGCISSYAYWDRDLLMKQRQLLNPQTGELDAVQMERVGEEQIVVRGVSVAAVHYRLRSARFTIDLWYSASGEWLQLDSTTESHRILQYRLATIPR
jgi:hypothetical protein